MVDGNTIIEDKFVFNLKFDDDACTQQSSDPFQEYPVDGSCVFVNNIWAMKFTTSNEQVAFDFNVKNVPTEYEIDLAKGTLF